MNQEYWQQQTREKPLFPNMLWSRPETKLGAGKLLIIGGQAQEFIHVAESFALADVAGAGTVRVIMPDSTRKHTKMLPNIEYAPSNSSGSFSKTALAELINASTWADGVLLAGDLGKNSETSLMLENFINTFEGLLVIPGASLPSISIQPKILFNRKQTVLVITFAELQKLSTGLGLPKPIISQAGNPDFAMMLHEISHDFSAALVVLRGDMAWNAAKGRVVSCKFPVGHRLGQLTAETTVWSIQNPNKLFEAASAAVFTASSDKTDKTE